MSIESVPTFGWDVVYALRIPQVNAHIAECGGRVRNMDTLVGDMSVTASVGGWRIVPGGSARVVLLSLDIGDGRITPWGRSPMKFAGEAIVAVEPQVIHWDTATGKCATLQLAQAGVGGTHAGPFSVQDIILRGIDNFIVKGVVRKAVQRWLDANPDAIQHLFATVDLLVGAKDRPFSWLRPTSISYAYCDAPEIGDCLLAVLAMVENRSCAGLDQRVSARAVPPGCDSAILISPHLLLDGIVRGAAMRAFPGTRDSDFAVSGVVPKLSLVGERELSPVMKDEQPRCHILKSFSVTFEGSELLCRTENMVVVDDEFSVTTSMQVAHGLSVQTQPDGGMGLRFVYLREPQITHRTHVDGVVSDRESHIDIADAFMIGGAIPSLFAGPLFFVVVTVETSILLGVAASTQQVEVAMAQPAPSMDLFISHAAAPCMWPGERTFDALTVDLAASLRLGGKLS